MSLVSTASSRSTAVVATFWLVLLLGNNYSTSYLTRRRVSLSDLYSKKDVSGRDATYDDDKSVSKRDGSGKGTCTCTCETKPVSASSSSSSESSGIVHPVKTVENYVPETASLMRTATGSRQGSTAGKTAEQQQDHDSKQYEVGDSGIVHVPPMKDYGLNAYESNFAEPSQQQQQQQVENAQQQQQADIDWEQERFRWELLPDRVCFRDVCSSDRDCCRRFNICDRSAHVCVDCWYGSSCKSERDCCLKYPFCEPRDVETLPDGGSRIIHGTCTNEL